MIRFGWFPALFIGAFMGEKLSVTYNVAKNRYGIAPALLCLATVIAYSVVLQLPELRSVSVGRGILFAAWGAVFIAYAVTAKVRHSSVFLSLVFLVLIFDCYSIFMEAVRGGGYATSSLFVNINMSLFLLTIGYMLPPTVDTISIKLLCLIYACAVLTITPYYIVHCFVEAQVFDAKNSLGPIMVCASILLLTMIHSCNRLLQFCKWTGVVWLTAVVFVSGNRASMVAVCILILYYVLFCLPLLRNKLAAITAIVVIIGCLAASPSVIQTISRTAGLGRYGDMDDFSSGRVSLMNDGIPEFNKSPIVGVGDFYVENFHFDTVIKLGILGCVPVFLIYLFPIFYFTANIGRVRSSPLGEAIGLIVLNGVVISFFEQQAPFGQGTTYFMLWLLVGYYLGLVAVAPKRDYRQRVYGVTSIQSDLKG